MSVCRYACVYSSMLVYFQGIDLGGLQSRLLQLSPRGWVCSAVWCEHLLAQARERRRAHPALFYIHCLLSRTVYMADKYEQGQCCPLSLMSKRKWKKKKKKWLDIGWELTPFLGQRLLGMNFITSHLQCCDQTYAHMSRLSPDAQSFNQNDGAILTACWSR